MGIVSVIMLFCLSVALIGASRKRRVAGGNYVQSPLKYPWIVYIVPVYVNPATDEEMYVNSWCTGSFIDVYGTVVTAAHCVDRTVECGTLKSCELRNVTVTWGVVTPSPNSETTTIVPDGKSITRFDRSIKRLKFRGADIALIFPSNFLTSPMNCSKSTTPQPIKLISPQNQRDWSEGGVFAGFGQQPSGYTEKDNEYHYTIYAGNLSEISLRHKTTFSLRRLLGRLFGYFVLQFDVYADINQDTPDSIHRHKMVAGTCGGDSGGPYMVRERRGMRQMELAGVLSRSWEYWKHPCARINGPNLFVDISNKVIQNWTLSELKKRYKEVGISASRIPATC